MIGWTERPSATEIIARSGYEGRAGGDIVADMEKHVAKSGKELRAYVVLVGLCVTGIIIAAANLLLVFTVTLFLGMAVFLLGILRGKRSFKKLQAEFDAFEQAANDVILNTRSEIEMRTSALEVVRKQTEKLQ